MKVPLKRAIVAPTLGKDIIISVVQLAKIMDVRLVIDEGVSKLIISGQEIKLKTAMGLLETEYHTGETENKFQKTKARMC